VWWGLKNAEAKPGEIGVAVFLNQNLNTLWPWWQSQKGTYCERSAQLAWPEKEASDSLKEYWDKVTHHYQAHAESISNSASAGTPAPRGEQHLNDNGTEWARLKIKEWRSRDKLGPMRRGLWKCSLPLEPTFTTNKLPKTEGTFDFLSQTTITFSIHKIFIGLSLYLKEYKPNFTSWNMKFHDPIHYKYFCWRRSANQMRMESHHSCRRVLLEWVRLSEGWQQVKKETDGKCDLIPTTTTRPCKFTTIRGTRSNRRLHYYVISKCHLSES